MNGPFEDVHKALNQAPRRDRVVIFRESLARAADDMPELARLQEAVSVNELGKAGMRELAHKLCHWGERVGVLDELFPLSAVEGGE